MMDAGLHDSFLEVANKYPDYSVWMTGKRLIVAFQFKALGHSLGGALASIAAVELIAQGDVSADRVKLYTFGQPRTGDKTYAEIHDKLVSSIYS